MSAVARKVFSLDVQAQQLATPTDFVQLDLLAADASLRRLDVQLVEAEARKRLRKLLRALQTDYDRIVLDCPPGLAEISEQVFRAVDLIVVPVPPSPLAIRSYEDVVAHIRRHHPGGLEILPVLSMVDIRRKLHREMVAGRPDWHVIPQASVVEGMSVEQAPLGVFDAWDTQDQSNGDQTSLSCVEPAVAETILASACTSAPKGRTYGSKRSDQTKCQSTCEEGVVHIWADNTSVCPSTL